MKGRSHTFSTVQWKKEKATRYSTAKAASQRTLYRVSAQERFLLDLNHVIAEKDETRKCIWTAAASCDAELDRGDGICVAIFGPPNIYLPGPNVNGGTVDNIRRLLSVFGGAVLRASLHERQRSLCTGMLTCTGGNVCTDTCLECV